ncbi:hypothetical protein BK026_13330 [Alteromonas sp. V450]|uniref:sulfite exporter TauE/SafE family protein n=1 Tax=Alteromonas sp. V450 TaxID=1912139 RepID=UPI0008FF697B|nr:sulfite exporter TauE/SafE family protein [Alteromonas sp. V450]OJF69681.1 hypothetical protein BK026_13330 [Alteromonas sp. V450]
MNLLYSWLTANDTLSMSSSVVLVVTSFFTSMMTATLGIGGGVLLLAVMAGSVPVSALIPVHGLVQLGSNGNRALMTAKHIDWRMLTYFSLGAVVGAFLASFIVVQLPLVIIQFAVAAFILFLVWGSKPKAQEMKPAGRTLAGLVTTLVSMFVGATGPLVAAFVHRNNYTKMQITGTFASCMTLQHGLKAFVFTFVGFSFAQWAGLIMIMIASGALGTFFGLKVLKRVPAKKFTVIFKVVVTILALRLVVEALKDIV